mmetsp:Transcript_70502/g.199011  ORF Transcript_70502/g.199011 Transcript_70502/m.199011 type:complete len:266 (+) Transcript_70502:1530-2327(+)
MCSSMGIPAAWSVSVRTAFVFAVVVGTLCMTPTPSTSRMRVSRRRELGRLSGATPSTTETAPSRRSARALSCPPPTVPTIVRNAVVALCAAYSLLPERTGCSWARSGDDASCAAWFSRLGSSKVHPTWPWVRLETRPTSVVVSRLMESDGRCLDGRSGSRPSATSTPREARRSARAGHTPAKNRKHTRGTQPFSGSFCAIASHARAAPSSVFAQQLGLATHLIQAGQPWTWATTSTTMRSLAGAEICRSRPDAPTLPAVSTTLYR